MNIELKPCPFCGGKAEARISPNSRSEEGASFYEVRCKKCGVHVTGKSFNFWTVEYNAEKPQDLLSAINRWNKRAYEEGERKTGKWIRVDSNTFKCSLCGNFLNFRGVNAGRGDANYCPNCGKKLEKEVENETS